MAVATDRSHAAGPAFVASITTELMWSSPSKSMVLKSLNARRSSLMKSPHQRFCGHSISVHVATNWCSPSLNSPTQHLLCSPTLPEFASASPQWTLPIPQRYPDQSHSTAGPSSKSPTRPGLICSRTSASPLAYAQIPAEPCWLTRSPVPNGHPTDRRFSSAMVGSDSTSDGWVPSLHDGE
jgi:hypothetical protein